MDTHMKKEAQMKRPLLGRAGSHSARQVAPAAPAKAGKTTAKKAAPFKRPVFGRSGFGGGRLEVSPQAIQARPLGARKTSAKNAVQTTHPIAGKSGKNGGRLGVPAMPDKPRKAAAAKRVASTLAWHSMQSIACVNHSTISLGVDFKHLIAALQKFADVHFSPVWGTPVRLVVAKRIAHNMGALVFLDDSDQGGYLGYHDLTAGGHPISKVFVKTSLKNKEKVSVTACHELCEMLVDPAMNLCAEGPDGLIYAYETADAVEEQEFLVNGIAMSNFMYPSWFETFRKPRSTKFDHLGSLKRPFEIAPGGYMPVKKGGKWTTIHGSVRKEKRMSQQDRQGRRVAARHARSEGIPVKHSLHHS